MPYSSMKDIPESLKTAGLTLSQSNIWARYYDEAKEKGDDSIEPAAIAWVRFKNVYEKVGDKWIKKENNMDDGNKFQTVEIEIPVFDINDEVAKAKGWTEEHLADAVNGFEVFADRIKPPLKLGHNQKQEMAKIEERNDGMPALGWADKVRAEGTKLFVRFKEVPTKLAKLINSGAWKRQSAEFYCDVDDKDRGKFKRILRGVALLGAEPPALKSLDDVAALYGENNIGRTCDVEVFSSDILATEIMVSEQVITPEDNGEGKTESNSESNLPLEEKDNVNPETNLKGDKTIERNSEVIMDKETKEVQEVLPLEMKESHFDSITVSKEEYGELVAAKTLRDQAEKAKIEAEAAKSEFAKRSEEFAEKLKVTEEALSQIKVEKAQVRAERIENLCESWQKEGKLSGVERPIWAEMLRRSDDKTVEQFGEDANVTMWDLLNKAMESRSKNSSVPLVEIASKTEENKEETGSEEFSEMTYLNKPIAVKNADLSKKIMELHEKEGISFAAAMDRLVKK